MNFNISNLQTSINQLTKFTTANKLLITDKFCIEGSSKKKKQTIIELTIGDIACFVKPHSDFVCDTIVRDILTKRYNGLESPTVYVLVLITNLTFTT